MVGGLPFKVTLGMIWRRVLYDRHSQYVRVDTITNLTSSIFGGKFDSPLFTAKIHHKTTTCFKSLNKMTGRGAFIVFEGCDRSGKTTQCERLVKRLLESGHKVKYLKFPDRTTTIGKMINNYLGQNVNIEDHAIHLLFSANRWESVQKMNNLIDQGVTLIVDRYAYSGVAFTAAKEGFSLEWCKQVDVGLPQPDKIFYLTLSAKAVSERVGFGKERYEKAEFQEKVSENFKKLQDYSWEEINADQTIEDLNDELYSLVKKVIDESKSKTLGKLWT